MTPRKRRSRRKSKDAPAKKPAVATRSASKPESEEAQSQPKASAEPEATEAAPATAAAPEATSVEALIEPYVSAWAENEALTSNLQDAEATRLLAWAKEQAEAAAKKSLAAGTADPKADLEAALSDLRKKMRSVNQQMEEAYEGDKPAAEQLEALLSAS